MTAYLHRYVTPGRLALAALLMAGALLPEPAATAGEAAPAAPAFELADEHGAPHALSAYRGQVLVLEWTNPDCPYVQRHYRSGTMEKLAARYAGKPVRWLAVNSTHYNTPEATRAWAAEQAIDYPTLQDAAGDVGRRYGARTTPHMFVIDPEGQLAYRGAIDDDPRGRAEAPRNYVVEAVDAVLRGESAAFAETRPYGCSIKYAR